MGDNKRRKSDSNGGVATKEKLKGKDYDKELERLHVELVKLQEWVKHKGLKVCIVFEGRDGAGKGGTIKAITERVSPRVFRVVALPAPTEREKSQMYVQRYLPHLPAAGEVVIFDRSWYNRAGVERVMGFCTEEDGEEVPQGGAAGREGDRRLGHHPPQVLARGEPGGADPPARGAHRRRAQDLEALAAWTSSPTAAGTTTPGRATTCSRRPTPPSRPGTWSRTDDKRRARLNIITHLLDRSRTRKRRARR